MGAPGAKTGSQNPDRDAAIVKLWDDGQSAGQIAKALQRQYPGITRNVVIGVAQRREARDKGVKPSKPVVRRTYAKPPPAPKPKPNPRFAAAHKARAKSAAAFIPAGFPRPPSEHKPGSLPRWEQVSPDSVALVDLPPMGCKWPLGDDRLNPMCCGAPRENDKAPYCARHAGRARPKGVDHVDD